MWSLRGPVAGFEHHRGLTHTFLGVPFEAAILLLLFFLYHRFRHGSGRSAPPRGPLPHSEQQLAPVAWGLLYTFIVLALLSHLFLDYTNNYGLRPFFPFNDRWYAASIVFIFDPLLFVLLVSGLVMPFVFGLIGREVGAAPTRYVGRGWAWAALVGAVCLWAVREVEHDRAVHLAQGQTVRAPHIASAKDEITSDASSAPDKDAPAPEERRPLLEAERSLASPDPFSIFRWYTVTDFGPVYRLGVADTRIGTLNPGRLLAKTPQNALLAAAEGSHLGRVYLDWSSMPVLQVGNVASGELQAAKDRTALDGPTTTVTFQDPRFMGDLPLLHRDSMPPLSGVVVLGPKNDVLAEGLDGRFGR